MDTVSAEPSPSRAPEPGPSLSQSSQQHVETRPPLERDVYAHPLLRVELRDLGHPATRVFLEHINAASDVADLVDTVVRILYTPEGAKPPPHGPSARPPHPPRPMDEQAASSSAHTEEQKPIRPHPHKPHVPPTRSVTLVLRDMEGVAYTTGLELDDDHKEIHFSLSYIQSIHRRFTERLGESPPSATTSPLPTSAFSPPQTSPPPSNGPGLTPASHHQVRKELMGVICHELVHCYQWNALGTAPGGLIEGIADYVRLNAGFVPPHWKREGGDKWDAGYQTTGYFLNWLDSRSGEGSVRRLNAELRHREYHDKLWTELFGKDVKSLWKEYCKTLSNSC